MTTLKDTLLTRSAKACFAVLLAASLVPVSALASIPAFAEDTEADATAFTTEVNDSQALGEPIDADVDDAEKQTDVSGRAIYAAAEDEADLGEGIQGEPSEPESGETSPANVEGAPIEESADEAEVSTEEDPGGTVTDIKLSTLETSVEEPFSFFAPFRLLFGAASNGWTVPLKSTNHEKWIDRLDLSGAVDANGLNYAQNFYNTLVEAADNDGTADWLIDWGTPNVLNSNGKVGGVYKVPQQTDTVGILATIIENNETTFLSSGFTASEERVVQYINEVYGAFDRDYPSSFWRDITFGMTFWRPKGTTQSYAVFILKAATVSPMDIRAYGYRSPADIRDGIDALNARVTAIQAAYDKSLETSGKQDSDYERVKFYNSWLCENNTYNTKFSEVAHDAAALAAFQAVNPDVWSAMSALSSRNDETGPVCEGYARALKVLCDDAGVGCVLVDGYAPGAGAHMWNYVRMGSSWYGVDSTWNDSGAGATSSSYDQYLLKGKEPFETTHPPTNQFVKNGTKFTNGPQLAAKDYNPYSVTFAGAITGLGPFAYGDEFPLSYNSTTEGDVAYEVVSGPATATAVSTVAEATEKGGQTTLTITGVGSITAKVTLTPKDGGTALTDTITITAGPRPLKTNNTVFATKVYDGTVDASVVTPGTLVSARTEPAYAKNVGVLDADKADIGVNLKSGSAAFLNPNASDKQNVVATYELVSPSGNADKLKLYTLAGHETETTTAAISKRPVTAYFALSSTRVLTSEELPTPTVRFEAASGDRGKLDKDDLQPAESNLKTTGMPATMPTDIPVGGANAYKVTWAMPNTSVLTEIAKKPAAGNYQVSLSSDTEANTVTLVIANEENTAVVPAENPSNGALYRVECRIDGINDETQEALKDKYTSAEDIIAKLLEKLDDQTEKDLADDRVAVYDMTLYIADEKGNWVKANEDNFPSEGVQVTLDYPEETKATSHSFYAAHMFAHDVTSGGEEHLAGDIETPEVLNGPDGVNFTLMGFSPVSLAWEDVPRNTQAASSSSSSSSSSQNPNGNGITTQAGQTTANQSGASNVSQTGDSLPVLTLTVVALACAVLIAYLLVRRSRQKKDDKKKE